MSDLKSQFWFWSLWDYLIHIVFPAPTRDSFIEISQQKKIIYIVEKTRKFQKPPEDAWKPPLIESSPIKQQSKSFSLS